MTKRRKAKLSKQRLPSLPLWERWGWQADAVILAVALLLTAVSYANALSGEFVYDDERQIVENPLIIESQNLITAVTSDVWAFKGGEDASSNYWRPTFVLWLIGNFRLFGLADTTGWHVAAILLHFGVTVLAYGLLRQLKVERLTAEAITLLFAVHPVHVESVTWISGVTDILLALGLLGSLWALLSLQERPAAWKWVVAIGLHVVAILAKELGIVYPLIVFTAVFLTDSQREGQTRWMHAAKTSVPFLIVAIIYFFLRLNVLGRFEIETAWHHPPIDIILTMPTLFVFYLRQMVFPYWIGPSYPVRAVTSTTVDFANFWLPLGVLAVVGGLLWLIVRRRPIGQFGLIFFVLLIVPAMNINAYLPEQIVHDRYLYLPLLGFLLAIVPFGLALLFQRSQLSAKQTVGVVTTAVLLLCLPLIIQTRRYNTAWLNNLDLWAWGVEVDPASAFNRTQYGIYLLEAGRLTEARTMLDGVLAETAVTDAYLARAELNIQEDRLPEAVADLDEVIAAFPNDSRAYERLAIAYQQAGQFDQAATILIEGRERIPHRRCAFTTNLGVALYLSGQKEAALAELETVSSLAPNEYNFACRAGLFHLGQLYLELGDANGAREALNSYLALSGNYQDEQAIQLRTLAQEQLGRLSP